MKPILIVCLMGLALVAGCVGEQREAATSEGAGEPSANESAEAPVAAIALSSSAFEHGGMIPAKYTCDGDNTSPPLAWGDPPEGTVSFALVMDDPDAEEVAGKIWVHWLLYNLPGDARSLPGGLRRDVPTYPDARAGKGDSGDGYGGPCPPPGRLHSYHFKLYALDQDLDLRGGLLKAELLEVIEGHVLAKGELIGRYSRQE
jgi:Raf kinase inhibitor-like YbhB/YbcL family protein